MLIGLRVNGLEDFMLVDHPSHKPFRNLMAISWRTEEYAKQSAPPTRGIPVPHQILQVQPNGIICL